MSFAIGFIIKTLYFQRVDSSIKTINSTDTAKSLGLDPSLEEDIQTYIESLSSLIPNLIEYIQELIKCGALQVYNDGFDGSYSTPCLIGINTDIDGTDLTYNLGVMEFYWDDNGKIHTFESKTNDRAGAYVEHFKLSFDWDSQTFNSITVYKTYPKIESPESSSFKTSPIYGDKWTNSKSKTSFIIYTDDNGLVHFFGKLYKYDDETDAPVPFEEGEEIISYLPRWYAWSSDPLYYNCVSANGTTQQIEYCENKIKLSSQITGSEFLMIDIIRPSVLDESL